MPRLRQARLPRRDALLALLAGVRLAALCLPLLFGFRKVRDCQTTTNFSIFFSFWFWRGEKNLEIALLKVPTFWGIIYPRKP